MRNLYTPAVMPKIFDSVNAAMLQTVDGLNAIERNAILIYAEMHDTLPDLPTPAPTTPAPTTPAPTSPIPTTPAPGSGSANLVPWVRLRVKHPDEEKVDVWTQLDDITLTELTPTANPPGGPVVNNGARQTAPVVLHIPNCYEVKFELISFTGATYFTMWAAPIEAAPAI